MNALVDVRPERGPRPGEWHSALLDLPGADATAAWDATGGAVEFTVADRSVRASPAREVSLLRVRLGSDLVAASALDEAKLAFDREKLAADERAGRRTIWFSLAAAVISAAATITVALIAKPAPAALAPPPPTYRQLLTCQQGLDTLTQLSHLPTQTVGDLQAAIQHYEATCRDPLKAAVDSAS
jgi:hypothetical protein